MAIASSSVLSKYWSSTIKSPKLLSQEHCVSSLHNAPQKSLSVIIVPSGA